MAVSATRSITVVLTLDLTSGNTFSAAANAASPGQTETRTLTVGVNTITPPTGGTTPKACTIVMPSTNTATLTLKGITGDTGVVLHPTDPTSIALNSPTATFVLTASAEIAGVRLIWT